MLLHICRTRWLACIDGAGFFEKIFAEIIIPKKRCIRILKISITRDNSVKTNSQNTFLRMHLIFLQKQDRKVNKIKSLIKTQS